MNNTRKNSAADGRLASILVLIVIVMGASSALAEPDQEKSDDAIVRLKSRISGNTAQPAVALPLEQQPAPPLALAAPRLGAYIDAELQGPLDRAVFLRQLKYYQRLKNQAPEQ